MLNFVDGVNTEYQPLVFRAESHKTGEAEKHIKVNSSGAGSAITSCYPVPFMDKVSLRFFIEEHSTTAELKILDLVTGSTIYSAQLNGHGSISLDISSLQLSGGVYTCILLVNGKIVDSVKMVKL